MDDAYDLLAKRTLQLHQQERQHRLIIGVAGVPGGGKSTLANEVCRRVNSASDGEPAVNVPMDGFHLYRHQLDKAPDPALAHARRGAHWTFDAQAYVDCLKSLRNSPGTTQTAPSFDHGVGDPVAEAITILPTHGIVISEGNYLLLPDYPWRELFDDSVFDETWYIDCDLDRAMERVYARQVGLGVAPEVSKGRIEGNDRPNGELIECTKHRAAVIVPSLPFSPPPLKQTP